MHVVDNFRIAFSLVEVEGKDEAHPQ